MRGLWPVTFLLCLLAFSFTAISLAATLVWVSHGTSCHAHFVGSRLLGFLVNLCAAVIIAVVAVAATATVALYKVATNNWPDTQATSVYLTLFCFRSFSLTHTAAKICDQVAIIVCRCWSSLLLLLLLYCSWQQQLAIVATTLARPPTLTPHFPPQWVLKNTLHVQNWSANATKSTRKKRLTQLHARTHAKKATRCQIAFASKSPIDSWHCKRFIC